jgi:hypothetical protein
MCQGLDDMRNGITSGQKARRSSRLLGLLIVFSGVAASLLSAFAAQTDDHFFPYSQGWLGGDSAYSIPLDSNSTLWLFGDTFVGKVDSTERRPSTAMIHNSIAIRKCQGDCRITYWWSGMYGAHPKSFFKTEKSDYYWPLDGFVYRDKLYIFWERMHKVGNGGAFGFDYSGVVLATISHYLAPPSEWQISYQAIATGNQVIPGIATTLLPQSEADIRAQETPSADYVYVFTLFHRSAEGSFVGLMRIPLSVLSSGRSRGWEYLDAGSHWLAWNSHGVPSDALKLIGGNLTEFSVTFHPDLHLWLAVYPTPSFLSNTASYSTANTLGGPWTEARTLFAYPEMKASDPRHTPHVFCYAAKEHPELEAKGTLALTYACNSTQEAEIMRDMRLYRPELIMKPTTAVGKSGTPARSSTHHSS